MEYITYENLNELVKNMLDPLDLFLLNQNIKPSDTVADQ